MSKSARLDVRIDAELKEKIQEYCRQKHTSISDIVTRLFVRVLEEEERRRSVDAEQI